MTATALGAPLPGTNSAPRPQLGPSLPDLGHCGRRPHPAGLPPKWPRPFRCAARTHARRPARRHRGRTRLGQRRDHADLSEPLLKVGERFFVARVVAFEEELDTAAADPEAAVVLALDPIAALAGGPVTRCSASNSPAATPTGAASSGCTVASSARIRRRRSSRPSPVAEEAASRRAPAPRRAAHSAYRLAAVGQVAFARPPSRARASPGSNFCSSACSFVVGQRARPPRVHATR